MNTEGELGWVVLLVTLSLSLLVTWELGTGIALRKGLGFGPCMRDEAPRCYWRTVGFHAALVLLPVLYEFRHWFWLGVDL